MNGLGDPGDAEMERQMDVVGSHFEVAHDDIVMLRVWPLVLLPQCHWLPAGGGGDARRL